MGVKVGQGLGFGWLRAWDSCFWIKVTEYPQEVKALVRLEL